MYVPVHRCICVNIHLGTPLMYGFITLYTGIYMYHFAWADQREK